MCHLSRWVCRLDCLGGGSRVGGGWTRLGNVVLPERGCSLLLQLLRSSFSTTTLPLDTPQLECCALLRVELLVPNVAALARRGHTLLKGVARNTLLLASKFF
jgi:hypothetical protein